MPEPETGSIWGYVVSILGAGGIVAAAKAFFDYLRSKHRTAATTASEATKAQLAVAVEATRAQSAAEIEISRLNLEERRMVLNVMQAMIDSDKARITALERQTNAKHTKLISLEDRCARLEADCRKQQADNEECLHQHEEASRKHKECEERADQLEARLAILEGNDPTK